jgi:hypothetical protein
MNNNYYQKYLKYKNKYLSLKNQMKGGAYTKSLCVDNPYHQHNGECWHDVICMVLHFSDDIKDFIQPQLYNKLSEADFQTKQKNDLFLPLDLEHDKINIYYANVFKYIEGLSERFINHYDNDKFFDIKNTVGNYERYEQLEEIKKIPIITKPTLVRQKSIQHGVETAVCIRQIFSGYDDGTENIYESHGGGRQDDLNIVNIHNQFFLAQFNKYISIHVFPFGYKNIFETLYTKKYLKYLFDNSFAITMNVNKNRMYSNHVNSIFKCDNEFYYYDDNYGIFPINITEFSECIDRMNLDTEHLRIKYNYLADNDKKYRKLVSVKFFNIDKNEPILINTYIVFEMIFYHLENNMDNTYILYKKLNSYLNVIFASHCTNYNINDNIDNYINDYQFNYLKIIKEQIDTKIKQIQIHLDTYISQTTVKNKNTIEHIIFLRGNDSKILELLKIKEPQKTAHVTDYIKQIEEIRKNILHNSKNKYTYVDEINNLTFYLNILDLEEDVKDLLIKYEEGHIELNEKIYNDKQLAEIIKNIRDYVIVDTNKYYELYNEDVLKIFSSFLNMTKEKSMYVIYETAIKISKNIYDFYHILFGFLSINIKNRHNEKYLSMLQTIPDGYLLENYDNDYEYDDDNYYG